MSQRTIDTTVRFNDRWVVVHLHFGVRWCQRLHIVGAVWKDHVFFANDRHQTPGWVVAHELLHVWQWRTGGGWWRHLGRYLRSLWTWGYYHSPYEREAVHHQRAIASGQRVLLPYRSAEDYRRNDDRSTVSTTAFTGIHAPILTDWDTSVWLEPGGGWWRAGRPYHGPIDPAGAAWHTVAPRTRTPMILPHLDDDAPDFDPGTYPPTNNDHEQDGA